MITKETGGPAFPAGNYGPHQQGMSLRDWFAGHALASMDFEKAIIDTAEICGEDFCRKQDCTTEFFMARAAYAIADAMLAERSKESTDE